MKEEANQILRYGIPANNDAGVVIRMGERIKLLEAKNQVYYGGADAKVKEKINFILKLVEDIDQAKSFWFAELHLRLKCQRFLKIYIHLKNYQQN